MKSIMQEASSTFRAIEAAWAEAGKPSEFTIKILEEGTTNFLGFVKEPAKIAFYFDLPEEKRPRRTPARPPSRPSAPRRAEQARGQRPTGQRPDGQRPSSQRSDSQRPTEQRSTGQRPTGQRSTSQRPTEQRPDPQRPDGQRPQYRESDTRRSQQRYAPDITPQWTEAMVELTQNWVKETLSTMNLPHVAFKVEPSDLHLRITFKGELLPDSMKEKRLFAQFAALILETLKRHFKIPLRGHKIVLLHATAYDLQSRR